MDDLHDILSDMDSYIDTDESLYSIDKIAHLEHLEDLRDALLSKIYNYVHGKPSEEEIQILIQDIQNLKQEIEGLENDSTI